MTDRELVVNDSSAPPVLSIKDLRVDFHTYDGVGQVLNGVSLDVQRGDIVGLVGESGCGKTTVALAVTGLLNTPPAKIVSGSVHFQGRDLLRLSDNEMRKVRAEKIGMIFQDPNSNLNPLLTIGQQLTDAVLCRSGHSSTLRLSPLAGLVPSFRKARQQAQERGRQMLTRVGIADAARRLHAYPGEFSGGMKQRTLTAMALGGHPELLIADEPTTALDVSTQSQVLAMVRDLVAEMGLSVLWITHDLGVVAAICNRVAVMYAGNIVEMGPARSVFHNPKHPYTIGLLQATPKRSRDVGRLNPVSGFVPSLVNPPAGCRFHTRCPHVMAVCRHEPFPPVVTVAPDHQVSCHLFTEGNGVAQA